MSGAVNKFVLVIYKLRTPVLICARGYMYLVRRHKKVEHENLKNMRIAHALTNENVYFFNGSNSVRFVLPPFLMVSTLQGNDCFFISRSHFGKGFILQESKRESGKLFPFRNKADILGDVSMLCNNFHTHMIKGDLHTEYKMQQGLFSSNGRGDGQTDSVPRVYNYGFDPLSRLGNIVMKTGQKIQNTGFLSV